MHLSIITHSCLSLQNEDGISENTDLQMSYHQPDLDFCGDKECIQKAKREPYSRPETVGAEGSLLLVKEQYTSQAGSNSAQGALKHAKESSRQELHVV